MATSNNRRSIQRAGLNQMDSNLLQVAVNAPATPKVPAKSSFAVHSRATNPCREYISASRRDYYKISLITEGCGTFTLGDRIYKIKAPSLLFINQVEVKT